MLAQSERGPQRAALQQGHLPIVGMQCWGYATPLAGKRGSMLEPTCVGFILKEMGKTVINTLISGQSG